MKDRKTAFGRTCWLSSAVLGPASISSSMTSSSSSEVGGVLFRRVLSKSIAKRGLAPSLML